MKTTLVFAFACFIIATGTTVLYRQLRPEWLDFRKGEEDFMEGAYTKAAVHYRHAIEGGLSKPCVFLRCAQAQLLEGNYQDADETEAEYLRHAAWRPDDAYEMAELFVSKGRFETASHILARIVAKDPEHRKARFRLAQVLTWTQNFDAAINHYYKLLGEQP